MSDNNQNALPEQSISMSFLQVRHNTRYRYARPGKTDAYIAFYRSQDSNEILDLNIEIDTPLGLVVSR